MGRVFEDVKGLAIKFCEVLAKLHTPKDAGN